MGGSVVVGYDGSESSRLALTWAAATACRRGLPVRIVQVLPVPIGHPILPLAVMEAVSPEQRESAERMLLAAEHETRLETPGVEVESRVVEGPTVSAILAELADAELAVLGSRGRGTFAELLVGSTALQVATHAPCPVVVVRSLDYVDPGPEAGRVVVGLDGSAASADALAFAFEEATLRGAGLTAIHAWQAPYLEVPIRGRESDRDLLAAFEREELAVLCEQLEPWKRRYAHVDVRERLVHDETARVLVEASAGAALVVVGSRGVGGFRSLLLGSVGHTVLHHAKAPVAVVRSHG